MVVRGMRSSNAGHHLEQVTVTCAGDQGVQAVLRSERRGELRRAPGERGDAPLGRISGMVGVPGLVGPEEVAEP